MSGGILQTRQVCPGCGTPIGPIMMNLVTDGKWSVPLPAPVEKCPHCGFEMVEDIAT